MPRKTKATLKKEKELATRQESKQRFLGVLSKSMNVTLAAHGAGLNRQTLYKWRAEDAEFAAAWDEALQEAIELLEAEAYQRARKQSDTLMIFLLKAHKPEKYRDNFTIRHETWENDAVRDIVAGLIEYSALEDAFDSETATRLFTAAGKSLPAK